MHSKTQSILAQRQRKLLLVAPLLILPFLTFGFWVLGGGSGTDFKKEKKGINTLLPEAQSDSSKNPDKMSFYDQAGLDSARLRDLKKNDPYYNYYMLGDSSLDELGLDASILNPFESSTVGEGQKLRNISGVDDNEKKIYEKLDRLNMALSGQPVKNKYENNSLHNYSEREEEIVRLKQMVDSYNQPEQKDPQMEQLNGVLEKLIDAQNPGLVRERLRENSEKRKGQVFAVSSAKKVLKPTTLKRNSVVNEEETRNNFFSLENRNSTDTNTQISVRAVIHESQTLVSGSTVKLRLTNDIFINGVLIPKDNFVFGIASLNGERLNISINSVRYKNFLFPVELSVYDLDGLNGIYIPGAVAREVAKESADQGIQDIGFNSINPSIGMQAASVGVQAAKTLFSKKVKLVRVMLKAGYQVLLKDEKQKDAY